MVDSEGTAGACVRLLGIPVRLWERAAQHNAELIREFNLITLAGEHGHLEPPQALIAGIQEQYLGLSEEPAQFRQEALARGIETSDLEVPVGPDSVRACQRLLEQMEEADSYCAAGVLMTLPTPPDQKALREWYLGEFVRQGQGQPPTPWTEPVD